jgi:hypothetical protein
MHEEWPVPAPRSLTTVADVAPVRLWRSFALTRLQTDPAAPPAAGADAAGVGAEPAVLVELVAVLVELVAVLVELVAVLVELVAVLVEPHAATMAMQTRENAMAAQRRGNMSRPFQEEKRSKLTDGLGKDT